MRRLALALVMAGLLGLISMGGMAASAAAQDLAFRGWGIRGGVSDDPDQVIVGAHANMGEFIPNLRFQPSLELGFGDDHKTFTLTAPAFYRYPLNRTFTIYGGGGLVLGLDRNDEDNNDGTELVISPELAGGFEWPAATGDAFVELGLLGGDLPNVRLMLGWTF